MMVAVEDVGANSKIIDLSITTQAPEKPERVIRVQGPCSLHHSDSFMCHK